MTNGKQASNLSRLLCAVPTAALALLTLLTLLAPVSQAQGSRKDDVVFGPDGHPVAGATVRVCQPTATGTPCNPLATLYTDATLAVTAPNPLLTDGIGNYHFYAPSGRYMIQITGTNITGTQTYPDVILAADSSAGGSGSNITAFGLTLGGNLSVAGNASIAGTFSTGNFSPSSLTVTGDSSVAGPRPYIDVTAYGAVGNNSHDDTSAIQAAINAYCTGQTLANGGSIYFPPGTYKVSQPQTPSTAPVFTICSGIHFIGGNSAGHQGPFQESPQADIISSPGSSPNAAPVFQCIFPACSGGITFENLQVIGYNQAVYINQASANRFTNTILGTPASGATGMPDNTPLKICNSVWNWFEGGQIYTNNTTAIPGVLFCSDSTPGNFTQVGLSYFENLLMSGGTFVYRAGVANSGSPGGNIEFRNITVEGAAKDFFTVQETTPGFTGGISAITIDHVALSDSTPASLINFNSTGPLSGIFIKNSSAGLSAIKMTQGSLNGVTVLSDAASAGNVQIVDASGNPFGNGETQNWSGFDHISDTSNGWRLNSDLKNLFAGVSSAGFNGPPLRLTASGSAFSTLALDPAQGILFGDGSNYGFSSSIKQSVANNIDLYASKLLPPASVSGTATTGGSLAAGTYYYYIRSTSTGSSAQCTDSSDSIVSGPVVVSGSNNAVHLTWALPSTNSPATPAGYCIYRSTVATGTVEDVAAILLPTVSGGSTTSATDTGGGSSASVSPAIPAYQAVHRFTANALGVNTTNPQFNLDVNGSAAVNSLNGEQKAERFSGSDAAAKINACLTAAAGTSGVCDARGLTGTLTATSHITIPAGTVLLWGQAQLTINDSTTNDAIEFTGDGAALIGNQESGLGTVPRADSSGYIACGIAGCTTIDNPNAATRNVDWINITGMYLQANGASSKVMNMTSIGHADIENNRFVLGTGGNSYGIFGDTSTGDLDSTNSLIKHNEFDPESTGDTCAYLAGVFNVVVLEQNSCYLAPGAGTGFVLAKDSNGNYPNNDEFYGNDCETASTAFNQICYNLVGAQSVVIGPNNRCENVYNCFQFPADGSAVGIHLLDPYISLSSHTVVKPNEPSTAMVAVDNNGHNWLPSMHFGLNDNAGPNLLNNSAFEGWASSTSLYYWGGVSGTNINQAGSGIYAQNTSSGSPAADSFTQGTYNVVIGDNATAGLGINSGCIQVDATMNYTLAFRIAASSTGIAFRPGFRFYSDANCTEANRITSASANARVLTPANYAGDSNTAINGANWQSTNASLTYNNGITCNCNVTGADWNVATANLWTATRNYAITFRTPNAYSSSATIAHSMRIFILENTAANPNKIYVDDIALSQGAVSTNLPLPATLSSTNPTVYGNLTVSGSLTAASISGNASTASALASTPTQCGPNNFATGIAASGNANCSQPAFSNLSGSIATGQLPSSVTLTTGTPTAGNCASFASTTTNVQDAGSPCPPLFTKYAMGFVTGGQAPSSTNAIDTSVIYLPNIQFSHITVDVSTTDASTSDFYSWAITDTSGNVKCSITAVNVTAGGASDQSCTQGTVTLAGGAYIFAFTGNATTGKIAYSGTAPLALSNAVSSSTSSSGAITFPITIPSSGVTYSGYGMPAIILH